MLSSSGLILTKLSALKFSAFAIIALLMFFSTLAVSQTKRIISGFVKDSTLQAISGAHVQLINGNDTLISGTDEKGRFSIKGNLTRTSSIAVRSIGYSSYSGILSFGEKQIEMELSPIILKAGIKMLDEVVIKAKINPVRLAQDTIEYNAGAYNIRDGDYVEDLLKQLPGVEIDGKGNVTTMGKSMTLLRVNGKDFFTGDIKEFIKKLPAEMFSQLQVIDDYGDEANFTGIKLGEPRKILNLVTKPGRDKGKFGNLSVQTGTNNSHVLNANANTWKTGKQLGFGGNFNNTRNSANISNGTGAHLNFRDQLSKKWNGNAGYSFSNSNNNGSNFITVQTINTLGTIYSNNQNHNGFGSVNHNFNMDIDGNIPKMFIRGGLNGVLSKGGSDNNSSVLQNGVIHQDIYTLSKSSNSKPSIAANFSIGRKFVKPGRSLMINTAFNKSITRENEDILTDIDYYDLQTNLKVKDSLLNRLVETKNDNSNFSAGFTFSEPMNKPKDTIYQGLDINYSFSMSSTNNRLQTNVRQNKEEIRFVDSLSNVYTSVFINQNLRLGYRYSNKKFNYNLGISAQPSTLKGSYEGRSDQISQTTVNTAPSANLNYQIKPGQSFGMNYNGNSYAPNFNQLQPVSDRRDLQNVIIGNPDLKTSFRHSANMNYRIFGVESGKALQLGINASTVQNEVVSNVILIKDTLNSLKQETRFQNVNGNYHINSNYNITIPFSKRKYDIGINGNVSYGNSVLFTDNVRSLSKRLAYSQSANFGMNNKWLTFNSSINYSYSGNSYTIARTIPAKDIQTFYFSTSSSVRFKKVFYGGFHISKSFNSGYAQGSNNPLMISMNMRAAFLKKQLLSVAVNANDLLNQGNNLYRIINDNTITDTRTKLVTRYLTVNLSLNLENFK